MSLSGGPTQQWTCCRKVKLMTIGTSTGIGKYQGRHRCVGGSSRFTWVSLRLCRTLHVQEAQPKPQAGLRLIVHAGACQIFVPARLSRGTVGGESFSLTPSSENYLQEKSVSSHIHDGMQRFSSGFQFDAERAISNCW